MGGKGVCWRQEWIADAPLEGGRDGFELAMEIVVNTLGGSGPLADVRNHWTQVGWW